MAAHDLEPAHGTRHTEVPPDECLSLLASHRIGRVAFTARGDVHIVPMSYVATASGEVVLRTSREALLRRASPRTVAFEIDGVDLRSRTGWSVCVHGTAKEVRAADVHAIDPELPPLAPWAPGERDVWVLVVPRAITGRRLVLRPEDPGRWFGGIPLS